MAADEFVPIPIGAHAVEFFAHRPAGNVLAVVFFGQDKVGCCVQGGSEQKGDEDGEEWFNDGFVWVGWWMLPESHRLGWAESGFTVFR